MAKKPSAPRGASKSKPAAQPITSPPDGYIETPLTAKDRLFNIASIIAREQGFKVREQELWAFVEEQFMPPAQVEINRLNRNADQMLVQMLARDLRMQEALLIAKGQVF